MLGNLGAALLKVNRPSEALPMLQRATEVEPAPAEHWYNLGLAELQTGDIANALQSANAALKREPSANTWTLQGRVAPMRRDFSRAIAALSKAATLGPGRRNPAVLLHDAGITLAREGDLAGAERLLQAAIAIDVSFTVAHRSLAMVQADRKASGR